MATPTRLAAPPRILFIVRGVREVSCRFRVLQYVPRLRAMGIEVDVADLRAGLAARLRLLRAAADYDAVCVHRALLAAPEVWALRRRARRLAFDVDDAVYLRDSNHARLDAPRRERAFRRIVAAADVVLAGNDELATAAAPHARQVVRQPTTIALEDAPDPERSPQTAPVIGWMGSASNLGYLRSILPALAELRRARPAVELRVVCDRPLGEGGAVDVPWSRATEAEELARFQIGIMPLADDAWTRGKCGAKLLQYFAAGLPVVCSPVGINRALVTPGENGFLADGDGQWIAHLERLLADADLRRRLGRAGRRLVEERFNADLHAQRLAAALLG